MLLQSFQTNASCDRRFPVFQVEQFLTGVTKDMRVTSHVVIVALLESLNSVRCMGTLLIMKYSHLVSVDLRSRLLRPSEVAS